MEWLSGAASQRKHVRAVARGLCRGRKWRMHIDVMSPSNTLTALLGVPLSLSCPSATQFPSSASISPTIASSAHDWRAFRAQLVAWERHGCNAPKSQSGQQRLQRPRGPALVHGDSWAHPIVEPEPGCLLLARNDDMNFFRESVVLITSHGEPGWDVWSQLAAGYVEHPMPEPAPPPRARPSPVAQTMRLAPLAMCSTSHHH